MHSPLPSCAQVQAAAAAGQDDAALTLLQQLPPAEHGPGAALALHLGQPRLAAQWTTDLLLKAAALLRLGDASGALHLLPETPTARHAVLRARALWQLPPPASGEAETALSAERALTQARREGDPAALSAAVTLRAEQLKAPYEALRTLAEGLKIAELTGQSAEAHLLAVLAHVQQRVGGRKAEATAHKALERSAPRSPARVLALLALGRPQDALTQAKAGDLHPHWWAFTAGPTSATALEKARTAADE